jgi:hypothetical protein
VDERLKERFSVSNLYCYESVERKRIYSSFIIHTITRQSVANIKEKRQWQGIGKHYEIYKTSTRKLFKQLKKKKEW